MERRENVKFILVHSDGTVDTIDGSAQFDSNGVAYAPQTVTVSDKHFQLNPSVRGKDWFEYHEIQEFALIKGSRQYRSDLH